MTTAQIKYARGLMLKAGLHDEKDAIVLQHTAGRTTHLTEMTQAEAKSLIDSLNGDASKSRMKRKIISMAHEMRWELANGKPDMTRINNWCMKHTPYHKRLDVLTQNELAKVVTLFEKVYLGYMKSI